MTSLIAPACHLTPAWQALQAHTAARQGRLDVQAAFAQDSARFDHLSVQAPHMLVDLSKSYLDEKAQALLLALAEECQLPARRAAMFAGGVINHTEKRQVLHTLLRTPAEAAVPAALADAHAQVLATQHAFLRFAETVRGQAQLTDVVHIGIGGSDLGPRMACEALAPYNTSGKRLHFVANVDAQELLEVLAQCRPHSTLFLIASKTFTTLETMSNAHTALAWFRAQGGTDVAAHFVGITTNREAAQALGMTHAFGFWDWVGGRYSLWSAIGLPLAISIGAQGFVQLLAGAHAMDRHFLHAPAQANAPLRLGLLDVYYRNFCHMPTRSVAPYHHGLRRLPDYLQQLEMESNGKRVGHDGHVLPIDTAAVVWGQAGTNGQHAYFQAMHQGTQIIPVEFIAAREPAHDHSLHQRQLLANALAQAQALMQGSAAADGHRHFPGNRPSTFVLLDRLDPAALGALIALYEHRVFVAGAIWGINSFDQFGVELGKVLAKDIDTRLQSGSTAGLDASTAGLLHAILQGRQSGAA